ncbi:ergot alkaloid biosynthesis protein [Catenuloplanes atrovinosus]|uniref:Uncharacterized protein YbjT (DUF2867 family) n=1 Tax=Catenuloplanes atrovinosus TaxID=137266 RepID=A0AAE3YP49_9ACTN|nr:ergot alkaloid biosynthesis protein [Catenuloplanes atrovinosus]MDR7277100.1 uncharacterized protein YbjT (DUF2867 family) [Catenuloplanes atrovinosus]
MTVLVTAASGTTGSRLARRLEAHGTPVRRAGRSARADVRFDWADPATHRPALTDVDGVYLVLPPGVADPMPVVAPFLAEARRCRVRRMVLLGSSAVPLGGPGLGAAGASLAAHVPEWAVLRPSWFASNFVLDHLHADSVRRHDEIVSATGDGRVPFIDPDDIAAVAARFLTGAVPAGRDVVLTGPAPLSFDDVAAMLSGVTGRRIRHRRVSPAELSARHRRRGIPAPFADLLAALDEAIAGGAEDRTTTTVQDITGTPPRSFADFLLGLPAETRARL